MNKRQIGTSYETRAAAYLQDKGYVILERNFRVRSGEIDLIAKDGEYLVFIEVKYRADVRMGYAEEAVDYRKQRIIYKLAQVYMRMKHIDSEVPCRFDVVAITGDDVTLYQNAFGY